MRLQPDSISLFDMVDSLSERFASWRADRAAPSHTHIASAADDARACVEAILQLRADLASFQGSPRDILHPPYTGRLQADIGFMAASLRLAASEGETVDGAVLLGFAVALTALEWRAERMERLLGIAPMPPTPPIAPAALKRLAAMSGGRIAA